MIERIDIVPAENVVGYPRTDGESAYTLLSFDLDSLEEDLNIKVLFSFRQEFDIDPSQIGGYDIESPLYIENTLSTESIYYNEEMKDLARRIVGEERNPYLLGRVLSPELRLDSSRHVNRTGRYVLYRSNRGREQNL